MFTNTTQKTNDDNQENTSATTDIDRSAINPFARSKGVRRSPTSATGTPKSTQKSQAPVQLPENPPNEKLYKLKQYIDDLHEYAKDRNNVHKDIKRLITSIRVAWTDLSEELNCPKPKMTADKTFTDNSSQTNNVPQASQPSTQAARIGKRRLDKTENPTEKSPLSKKNKPDLRAESSRPEQTPKENLGGWTTVSSHRNERKKHKEKNIKSARARPEAFLIGKLGETTYASILKQVKSDPNLKNVGENVSRIRRTQKGELLMELKKDSNLSSAGCKELIEGLLKNHATVRTLSQEIVIECRDLDEITTPEEIRTAIEEQFTISLPESAIRNVRKAYGETQTAVLGLSVDQAQILLAAKKAKIGWSICRFRELVQPLKCFRCLGFGHIAAGCTDVDRSKMCRKCGEVGHIAKTCTKTPQCLLCTNESGSEANHITGSSRCPKYRSALDKTKK